jgi:predicted glycosyltransferase involved in capsule biosynthesis
MPVPPISIMIPFRNTGDRDLQLEWLQKRWALLFPEAQVIVCPDDNKDPFSKTMAVNNCYKESRSDILAIVDADVFFDYNLLSLAAEKIRRNKVPWVMPCKNVYRLTEEYTFNLISKKPNVRLPKVKEQDLERISVNHGAITVFTRSQFEGVGGMDERFRGWGGEDNAWNFLLGGIYGKPEKWDNFLYHLWHPKERGDWEGRSWVGQTEKNTKLYEEYSKNKNNLAELEKLAEKNVARNQHLFGSISSENV